MVVYWISVFAVLHMVSSSISHIQFSVNQQSLNILSAAAIQLWYLLKTDFDPLKKNMCRYQIPQLSISSTKPLLDMIWMKWTLPLWYGARSLKHCQKETSTLSHTMTFKNQTKPEKWQLTCVYLRVCVCVQNALQFIKQCWKMQGRPLFLVLIREDNIK